MDRRPPLHHSLTSADGDLPPSEILDLYLSFVNAIIEEQGVVDMDPRMRAFLQAGDAAYRETLGDAAPPRQYSLAMRMMGMGVQTRSRTRAAQAAVSPGPPPQPPPPPASSPPPASPPPSSPPAPSPTPAPPSSPPAPRVWRPWDSPPRAQVEESRPQEPALPTIEVLATTERVLKQFKNTTFRQETMQLKGVSKDMLTRENMESFLQTVIDRQTQAVSAQPHDRCVMEISSSEHTDRPIWIALRRIDQIAPDVILHQLVRTLNSNESFLIDGRLDVKFIHVPVPKPGGRPQPRPCESVDAWLQKNNKSGCIFSPKNDQDSMCLARAVFFAQQYYQSSRDQRKRLRKETSALLEAGARYLCATAELDPQMACGLDGVHTLQKVLPKHRLCVFTDRRGKERVYVGPTSTLAEPRTPVYLFLHEGHYHAILRPLGAFDYSYFCARCLVGYTHTNEHACPGACVRCGGPEEHSLTPGASYKECIMCNRHFPSDACYRYHKEVKIHNRERTTCDVRKFCKECHQPYRLDARGKRKKTVHLCNSFYCKYCKEIVVESPTGPPHRCYILSWEEQPMDSEKTDFLRCYVDTETTQFEIFENKENWKEHRVNFLVCQTVCSACENQDGDDVRCAVHGERTQVFHCLDDPHARPVSDFIDYLVRLSSTRKKRHITIWSHNGAGFDHHFYVSELVRREMIPKMICKGLRILSMSYGTWVFKDSFLFIGAKLSKLPSSFGIEGVKKGDFPYLFSHPDHYNYKGEVPALEYYSLGTKSTGEAESLKKWHSEQRAKNAVFDFRQEIREYTINDVRILRLSCERFRKDFIQEAGFDALHHCITLSSTVLCMFRRDFMTIRSMGIIPRPGYYRGLDTQSVKALEWLKYENALLGGKGVIQYAATGREKRLLGKFKVDGYLEMKGEKIIYDFLGCWYHSHPVDQCLTYRNGSTTERAKVTQERKDRYYSTLRIHDILKKQGFKIKAKWECYWDSEKKYNPKVKAYFESTPFQTPPFIKEREGLYGGRTETFVQYHKCDLTAGEKIKYYDYQSLYPSVLLTKKIITQHPTVYVGNDPKCPPLDQIEGYIFCRILPPLRLHVPVLPWRAPNKRLLFVLCRTCAVNKQSSCDHAASERELRGVWPVPEVRLACQKGYQILEVYEVWNFENCTTFDPATGQGGIFASFICHWARKKIEYSGWPSYCDTQESKADFIRGCKEQTGIVVDPDAIQYNAALRHLMKLICNSGWGKVCEVPHRTNISLVNTYKELLDFVVNDTVEVQSIIALSDTVLQITWKPVDDCVESLPTNSVITGAYTTMHARLELYGMLDLLQERAFYCDTDSTVFLSKPGLPEPSLGPYVGQLTDELEAYGTGSFCYEWVSGGAKQYCMKIACGGDVKNTKVVVRLRGISLNYSCSNVVTFERFKEMVVEGRDPTIVDIPSQIARVKGWNIVTRPSAKLWRPTLNKRLYATDGDEPRPFGQIDERLEDYDDQEAVAALSDLYNQ